jgi:hypothetical protein
VCRFEEACAAYTEGGRPELGLALLQQLADNAVLQCRFADAAHGYYKLAIESLKVIAVWLRTACVWHRRHCHVCVLPAPRWQLSEAACTCTASVRAEAH